MTHGHSVSVVNDPQAAAAALHPIRRSILASLQEPDSATGLAGKLNLTRQKVNYHLKALAASGFVEVEREVRKRNCVEQVMRLKARRFFVEPGVLGFDLDSSLTAQDQFSATSLVTWALRTATKVASLIEGAEKKKKRLATLACTASIRFESPGKQSAFSRELSDLVAGLVSKYDYQGPGGRDFEVFLACHPKPKEDSDEN